MIAQLENMTVWHDERQIGIRLAPISFGSTQIERLSEIEASLETVCNVNAGDGRDVMLDLSQVDAVGASLVGIVANCARRLRLQGRKLRIVADRWNVVGAAGLSSMLIPPHLSERERTMTA